MKSSKIWIVAILILLLGAGGAAFFLLRRAASREVELLRLLPPDSDLYFVADVQSLSKVPAIQKLLSDSSGIPHDPEYDQFIRETGFRYQDDLQQLAASRTGDDWVGAAHVSVDRSRVTKYLESHGATKNEIQGRTVFSYGRERPFRIVFLDSGSSESLVAFTIGGDDLRIRQAVERHAGGLKDSAAAELRRRDEFALIPPGSGVWLIARPERLAGAADAQFGSFSLNEGFFRGSKAVYISLSGGPMQFELRAEDYCDGVATAQRIANSVQGVLGLLKAMPAGKASPVENSNAATDTKALLAGISVEQVQQSVVLRWKLDENALKLLESVSRDEVQKSGSGRSESH